MRLFYAILLSEEVLDALTDAQERLRAETVGGRLSRRENLHLTLSFLGETDRLDAAKHAGEGLRSKPFSLSLRGAGSFRSGTASCSGPARSSQSPCVLCRRSLPGGCGHDTHRGTLQDADTPDKAILLNSAFGRKREGKRR